MTDLAGQLVQATAGRDSDGVFCVVGAAPDGRLLLADGKRRSVLRPKKKQLRHVRRLEGAGFDHPALGKLQQGEPVTDRELRRALAAFKEGIKLGER